MLKKVFNFIAGNSEVTRDLFDRKNGHLKTFGAFVGNMKFTREEMAEMDAETAQAVREFAKDTMSENTDRSKSRRESAIFILRSFVLFLFMSGIIYPFNPEWASFWLRLAVDTELGILVSGVGLFFWGTHTLRSYNKRKPNE